MQITTITSSLLIFILISTPSFAYHMSEEEIVSTVKSSVITCGSTLRIRNEITKYHLSSFNMNWSTGSHLQIITAVKEDDSYDSLFTIKEGDGLPPCENGEPIKCNSIIRLEHVKTGKNLHSHEFPSFITRQQEACAFGENGEGDVNDNFRIICYKWNEEEIKGETSFFLQHVPTEQYLFIDYKKSLYNDHNCRGCPINGQREVSLTKNKDKQCLWHVAGGILFNAPDREEATKNNKNEEDNDDGEEIINTNKNQKKDDL